jgi:hypothetical protein
MTPDARRSPRGGASEALTATIRQGEHNPKVIERELLVEAGRLASTSAQLVAYVLDRRLPASEGVPQIRALLTKALRHLDAPAIEDRRVA